MPKNPPAPKGSSLNIKSSLRAIKVLPAPLPFDTAEPAGVDESYPSFNTL